MTIATASLIRHTEKLDTICYRLMRPADQDQRREELIVAFEEMATDLGKLAISTDRPQWSSVHAAMMSLRIAAVNADESRAATFTHVGAEAALLTSLYAFASVLGIILDDAATARVTADDEAARLYAEGHGMQEAAE